MCGVTKLDRIRNERIRWTKKVGEISKQLLESRLKRHGNVMRREYVGERLMVKVMVPDGSGGEKKGRKTEAEVDGQHQERLDREGIIE